METIKVGSEREVKFNRNLRYERQANYDIAKYQSVPFAFETGNFNVYKNFNFSIFTDDYCNADCKFCVAQLRYENQHMAYHKEKLSDDDYLKRLDEVLKYIRPLNPSISITGGEPTLSKKLVPILELVNKYNFRKRTITTNGSQLFAKVDGTPIIEHLIKNHWDHLNISRTSTDDKLNQQIMRFRCNEGYCNNGMLKEILDTLKDTNLKHRISCLLLKESVNSVEKIRDYVDFYTKLGANNFIFRELMDYDETAINKEKMDYCKANKIRLNNIWEDFEKFPELEPYMNILGYYYYVEIYKYHGATVASESANLNQQAIEVAKNPNQIYEMVYHPNGNLCASWIDKERILMKY